MKIIKHKSCNNRVKLLIIPTYSTSNYELNSTLTITIQQIFNYYGNTTIKYIQ
jgi:hypothetical protein